MSSSNSDNVNLDRRRFITGASKEMGAFLTSPTMGLIASAFGMGPLDRLAASVETTGSNQIEFAGLTGADIAAHAMRSSWAMAAGVRCIRQFYAAEPMTVSGEPFGTGCGQAGVLRRTQATGERLMVLVPHGRVRSDTDDSGLKSKSTGASLLEFDAKDFSHNLQSHNNKRWHGSTSVTAQSVLDDGASEFTEEQGLAGAATAFATPWNTFLLGTKTGLVEVNAQSDLLLRRAWITNREVEAVTLASRAGAKLSTYLWSNGLLRVTSRQYFDARMPATNHNILSSGDVERLSTKNSTGPVSLSWCAVNDTLYGVWDGKLYRVICQKEHDARFDELVTDIDHIFSGATVFVEQVVADQTGGVWLSLRAVASTREWFMIAHLMAGKPLQVLASILKTDQNQIASVRLSEAFCPAAIFVGTDFHGRPSEFSLFRWNP